MGEKCLISKGHINKYILFALLAGVSKCFVSAMLYIFKEHATYNNHPLIIGFNAGIGMSLSIIPLIIVKNKSHRDKKKDKSKINQTSTLIGTNSASSWGDLNYMEKYDKKKLRTQKYLILLACAFLDFCTKIFNIFLKIINYQ